jgi:hypothetical protein
MILPALALLLLQQDAPPPNVDPAILAYYNCVADNADAAEARTRDAAAKPAPEVVFIAAETSCAPLYGPALEAYFATTMKAAPIQDYARDKDPKQLRAEVEAGLRTSLKDRIILNIARARSGAAGNTNAQNR